VFVGEFIGSPKMNVVPGTLMVSDGSIVIDCLGVRTDVTFELAGRLGPSASNGPVLIGIRPHDLHLAGEAATDGPKFKVAVDICEHTGTEIFATVELGEQRLIARLPRSPVPSTGQTLELTFNKDRLHLFDVESRLSLMVRNPAREHVNVTTESSTAQPTP